MTKRTTNGYEQRLSTKYRLNTDTLYDAPAVTPKPASCPDAWWTYPELQRSRTAFYAKQRIEQGRMQTATTKDASPNV